MSDCDLTTPETPFFELWKFTVTLTAESGPNYPNPAPAAPSSSHPSAAPAAAAPPPITSLMIRDRVVEHFRRRSDLPTDPENAGLVIRREILHVVEDRLSGPDFRFFVTDYEERPGSWEIEFGLLVLLYGGVCGYGSFRQGIDIIYSDLKLLFSGIQGIGARVRKRFKERQVLAKPNVKQSTPPGQHRRRRRRGR